MFSATKCRWLIPLQCNVLVDSCIRAPCLLGSLWSRFSCEGRSYRYVFVCIGLGGAKIERVKLKGTIRAGSEWILGVCNRWHRTGFEFWKADAFEHDLTFCSWNIGWRRWFCFVWHRWIWKRLKNVLEKVERIYLWLFTKISTLPTFQIIIN